MRTPMRQMLSTACLLLTIPSCGRNDVDAPPPIVLGDSTCQECGMIISDERFATSTIIENERGYQPLLFDDFNCQIKFERKFKDLKIVNRWSHEHAESTWIKSEVGWFVYSTQIRSPMASGLAMFETKSQAEAFAQPLDAEVLNQASAWQIIE